MVYLEQYLRFPRQVSGIAAGGIVGDLHDADDWGQKDINIDDTTRPQRDRAAQDRWYKEHIRLALISGGSMN